jgi:hypothetical protein
MTISSNPGQDVTVKLDLPTNNTEAGPVSCSFTFQTAKGLLGSIVDQTLTDDIFGSRLAGYAHVRQLIRDGSRDEKLS